MTASAQRRIRGVRERGILVQAVHLAAVHFVGYADGNRLSGPLLFPHHRSLRRVHRREGAIRRLDQSGIPAERRDARPGSAISSPNYNDDRTRPQISLKGLQGKAVTAPAVRRPILNPTSQTEFGFAGYRAQMETRAEVQQRPVQQFVVGGEHSFGTGLEAGRRPQLHHRQGAEPLSAVFRGDHRYRPAPYRPSPRRSPSRRTATVWPR
ncbi:hypothetical protein ACRAWD_16800 [Caulobacter segnis]